MNLTKAEAKSWQIAEVIRKEIASGSLHPGEKLESSRQLADRFHVGRQVLRSAFKILEKENIVRSVSGSGVYINDFIPASVRSERVRVGFVNWHDIFTETFPLRAYRMILQDSQNMNCDIFLNNAGHEKELIEWVRNYNLDGLILCGFVDDMLVSALNDSGVLFLILGNYQLSEPVNCLEKDVFRSNKTAMLRLIRKYHFSRIACIFGTMFGLGPRQTLAGIREAAEECSVPFDETMLFERAHGNGYAEMEYLFQEKNIGKSDIVYLSSEVFAGAARAIFERKVPPEKRPYLFLDMSVSSVPYPDLVGCFLYEDNVLAENALKTFLDIYYGRVKRPWKGMVEGHITIV